MSLLRQYIFESEVKERGHIPAQSATEEDLGEVIGIATKYNLDVSYVANSDGNGGYEVSAKPRK